jgi:hypothetical protein
MPHDVRVRVLAQSAWHLLRYLTATALTSGAVALVPIALILLLTILAAIMLILTFIGGSIEAGPIMALLANGFLFLAVVVGAFVSIFVVVILAIAFTTLGILPISVVAEFTYSQHSEWATDLRLVGFLVAGFFLGSIAAVFILITIAAMGIFVHPLAAFGISVLMLSVSVLSVFLFGLTLTLMNSGKNRVDALWRTLRGGTR